MTQIKARSLIDGAASAAAEAAAAYPPSERRRRLSPAASAVASQKVPAQYSVVVIGGLVRLADLCLIGAAGLLPGLARLGGLASPGWDYAVASAAVAIASVVSFQAFRLYDIHNLRTPSTSLVKTAAVWSAVLLLCAVAAIAFAPSDAATRLWLSLLFPAGLGLLLVSRLVVGGLVKSWMQQGRLTRRTVVVGADGNGQALIAMLKSQPDTGIEVLGVFDDRNDDRSLQACAGVPKLGKVADIVEFARRTRLDLVLFALPISAETRILNMLKQLWVLPVDIRLSAHSNSLQFRPSAYAYLGNVPTIHIGEQPIQDWDLVTKWLFDRIVGGLVLLLISPILAVIAIAIKLDSPGPVLFKQKRFGFNNDRVDVFKFRSLYHDQADPLAAKTVTKGDKRVTRVGRFIRRSSLDELPQLFNVVFAGNLSLVGPRPHAVQQKLESRMLDEAVDGYFARHRVKPGMTGWAQINGWRGELDTTEKIQKRVEFDLAYIENWSLLFDVYILAKTPLALLKPEGAY
ncbi:MAG: undecaprenyl-phosphate glucose phosphotransferase [Hyphomicrobiaceae bacterium]|nr:undecaprenyl-phosphate glucose phosphotransferase [Hyphomicrobiaceae bacterium]